MQARVPSSLSRRFGAVAASLARQNGVAQPLRLTSQHARELGHLSRNFTRLPASRGKEFLEDVARRAAALLPRRAEDLHTLIPARLFSDKPPPKGFEGFFKKGEEGAKESPTSEPKETPAATPKVDKASGGGDGGGDNKGDGGDKKKKKGDGEGPQWEGPLPQILATLAVSAVLLTMMSGRSDGREINFQEFLNSLLIDGRVDHLQVINSRIVRVFLKESTTSRGGGEKESGGPSQFFFTVGSVDSFERRLEQAQYDLGLEQKDFVPVLYGNETSWTGEMLKFAPTILIIAVWLYVMRQMSGGAGGMGGGGGPGNIFKVLKAKPTIIKGNQKEKVTFADVAGLKEAKVEVYEFVEFLKNPDKFKVLGAKIPKGALLCGPPGTGKTLLAKAMAGEAGVPFLSISGSDFIEMFVGVGASRVRDLFTQARANTPCIVFIDEIDAVGRARGKGGFSGGGNDERENTLNQLLVEMDGFNPLTGIVVLAGTNRADILDPALLRPGRFDRQIQIDKPDIGGRFEIYQVHLKKIKLGDSLDEVAKRMASLTPGFSGADIANVCNEAALIAARHAKTVVGVMDFEAAVERVIGGLEKKGKVLTKEERTCVAYHEAGHAICGWFLEHADPLLKVSIVPRGSGALGYNQFLPREAALYSTEQLLDMMCMALGGRVAEEVVFGRITTGASDDLNRVTKIAYQQVSVYGMNKKVGQLSYQDQGGENQFKKPYSEATAQMIDEEARLIVANAYQRTMDLVNDKRAELNLLAEKLLAQEVLTHTDVLELLGPRPFEMSDNYKEFVDTNHKWASRITQAEQETKAKADAGAEGVKAEATVTPPGDTPKDDKDDKTPSV